jgi:membrane protease YdiL (CAAX protease family)
MSGVRKQIATFLILTFGISGVFYYLIISAGSLGARGWVYPFGLMWCPGIAALITTAMYQKNLRGLGWAWGKTRYQLLSYLLPIVYGAVVYGIVWASGLGGIDHGFTIDPVRFVFIGTLMSCASALGEEIGWRGFLVPRLARLTNFTRTALISGLSWAVWHWPILLLADYHSGTTWWWSLLNNTVILTTWSFAFAWLRLRSNSVWTAMILHGSLNLYIQRLFDPLTTDTGPTEWIIGEFGAGPAIAGVVIAFMFWRLRDRIGPGSPASA